MKKELRLSRMTLLLLIGLLAMCLTACEKRLQTITVTELVTPPDGLLTPCEKPEVIQMQTNDDLIKFASLAILQWEQCSAKIEALRIFFGLDKVGDNPVETSPVASEPH